MQLPDFASAEEWRVVRREYQHDLRATASGDGKADSGVGTAAVFGRRAVAYPTSGVDQMRHARLPYSSR